MGAQFGAHPPTASPSSAQHCQPAWAPHTRELGMHDDLTGETLSKPILINFAKDSIIELCITAFGPMEGGVSCA